MLSRRFHAPLPEGHLRRVLAQFRQRYAGVVTRLRELHARGDAAQARQLVHDLKGTSAQVAADRVVRVCKAAEAALDEERDWGPRRVAPAPR